MTIRTDENKKGLYLVLQGDFSIGEASMLFDQLLGRLSSHITIDLEEVDSFDVSALSIFNSLDSTAQKFGGSISVIKPSRKAIVALIMSAD
jgi:anti-anti-sigma regulatory factor